MGWILDMGSMKVVGQAQEYSLKKGFEVKCGVMRVCSA